MNVGRRTAMASKANAGLLILVSDVERYATGPINPHLDPKDVTTDCLGRGWVTDAVGKRLLEAAQAAWKEEVRLQTEHREYLADRQARRTALAQKISNDLGGAGTPAGHARIWAAQREALTEFDEKNPELDFYRWRDARTTMAAAR